MSDSPKKIFVVEDDPLLARAYHEALAAEGFVVEIFFNADDAYTALSALSEKPALILSDIMMPKTNGLQFLEKVRSSISATIPFILITSLTQKVHEDQAHALGVSAYMMKEDFTIKDLTSKIASLVQ